MVSLTQLKVVHDLCEQGYKSIKAPGKPRCGGPAWLVSPTGEKIKVFADGHTEKVTEDQS